MKIDKLYSAFVVIVTDTHLATVQQIAVWLILRAYSVP